MNVRLVVYQLDYDEQGSWYNPLEIELDEKNLRILKVALEKLNSTDRSAESQEEGEALTSQDW